MVRRDWRIKNLIDIQCETYPKGGVILNGQSDFIYSSSIFIFFAASAGTGFISNDLFPNGGCLIIFRQLVHFLTLGKTSPSYFNRWIHENIDRYAIVDYASCR